MDSSIPVPGPTVDINYFPDTVASEYWSSTTDAFSTNDAWIVSFYLGGYVYNYYKTTTYYVHVRAVRGGQPEPPDRFIDNGDGTVTDIYTGLMWQQATAPGTYMWQQALTYCQNLALGNYSDWRLPNRNELQTIVDYTSYNPSIETVAFPDTVASEYSGYWSSTTVASEIGFAWGVDFKYGVVYGPHVGQANSKAYSDFTLYVRAVRGGPCGSFGDSDNDSVPDITEYNYGTDTYCGYSAEPVNTALGSYVYEHTDLTVPGIGMPFKFTRAYNSLDPYNGPLGYAWTYNYNILLTDNGTFVTVKWGDGHENIYYQQPDSSYLPAFGSMYDVLVKNPDNTFTVTRKDQTLYLFDTSGKLTSIADRNANTITFTYDIDNNLTTVTDTAGRDFIFSYDAQGRITQLDDPIGRTISYEYDGPGDLIRITDANGGQTWFDYDSFHRITRIILPQANILIENIYDYAGKVVSQTNGRGYVTAFEYDFPYNNQTTITDPSGNTTVHIHDTSYRLLEVIDPLGNSIQYTYDSNSNRTGITDKNGNITSYTYDAMGNVTSKTDTPGNVTTITYDSNNNPLSRTDATDNQTTYSYDAKGNLLSTTDALGNITTTTYNSQGQAITVTDADNNTTTFSYDAEGNLIETEDALHNITAFTYDVVGRRISISDPDNNTTYFSYDNNTNLLIITDPPGGVIAYTYDANNNRTSETDPNNNTTMFDYDNDDLLVSVTDPLLNVTSYTYNELDKKESTTDARGNMTIYAYDETGNLIQVEDALNNITTYVYDANGNLVSMTNAKGETFSYSYDALNRLIQSTDPLGNVTQQDYDVLGRLIQKTDAEGNVTTFSYDPSGRLIKVVDAMNNETMYEYDNAGNRTLITDARGKCTGFTYDALNRLIEKTDPLANSYSYSYDSVGNRISLTDANGNTINYTYDANRRLTEVDYPDNATVTFTYDSNGNRTGMIDKNGTSTYQYDALNRLTNHTDSYGKTAGYGYDEAGNRTTVTYPDGKQVSYANDALNRISAVTDWLGGVTSYSYDSTGNVSHMTNPNNTAVDYTYDTADRLTALNNERSDNTTIAGYSYTLDALGNHKQVLRNVPLDPVLTPQLDNYLYDDDNRMTEVNADTYAYDSNGNVTGSSTGNIYTYDYEDRLTEATTGGTTCQYVYDGAGNRIARTESAVTTRYVLDLNGSLSQVLAETDDVGIIDTYYVYGPGLISRISPDNSTSYFHYDSRGSTVALTDAAEAITDKYAYDEFGKLSNSEGTTQNPFKYVGRFGVMDEGNGLHFMRARYYDAGTGRFLSKDVMQGKSTSPQELNRYAYVVNNPVMLVDISGLSAKEGAFQFNALGSSDSMHDVLLPMSDLSFQMAGSTPEFIQNADQYISKALSGSKVLYHTKIGLKFIDKIYEGIIDGFNKSVSTPISGAVETIIEGVKILGYGWGELGTNINKSTKKLVDENGEIILDVFCDGSYSCATDYFSGYSGMGGNKSIYPERTRNIENYLRQQYPGYSE